MRLPNVKRPHGFQELATLSSNTKHPELYWTKRGIHIHPFKNWFLTRIDIFLIENEWVRCEMTYLILL